MLRPGKCFLSYYLLLQINKCTPTYRRHTVSEDPGQTVIWDMDEHECVLVRLSKARQGTTNATMYVQ